MTPVPIKHRAANKRAANKQVAGKKPSACIRCNEKKTKCRGLPSGDCQGCVKAMVVCERPETGTKVMVLEKYVRGLEAENTALKARARELQSNQPTIDTESVAMLTENEEIKQDYNSLFDGMEKHYKSRSGEHSFIGCGTATIVARSLGDRSQNLGREFDPQDAGDVRAWMRPPSLVFIQLPPPSVGRSLYKAQYAYIGTIFTFAQKRDFEERMEYFSKADPDPTNQEKCLQYCQLLLVYAFGQLYSINQWTLEGPPGLSFFKHALGYLPGAHEPGSVLFVEVLGMVGYYLQVLNRREAAFLYIGMALRMAISLGLHQELGASSDLGLVDREHRRRVWWSVYSMDRIITVKSGNPITIHDGDIGVNWPSPLEELDGFSPVALVLSYYSKLSKILGKIGEDIYRRKHDSANSPLVAIQSIMNDLSAWWLELPAELKIDLTTMHEDLSRQAVSIYLHFHQCVHMTVRPLLYSVTQRRLKAQNLPGNQDWKEDLPVVVVSSIERTIVTARIAAQISSAALSKNLFATYGYMDGEHAFSSALTLVMANVALDNGNENAAAMETALHVLQTMAEKGNRYVEYRLGLLQTLRNTIPVRDIDPFAPDIAREPHPEDPFGPLGNTVGNGDTITPYDGYSDQRLTDFPPLGMQDTNEPFEFFFVENDANMGFPGDQVWIQDTQLQLQEQR